MPIADSGIGIPESEIPHLFKRFHRVENARGRTHEGTGIGLALVSELVNLHGGSVAVASRMGREARFVCRFLLEPGICRRIVWMRPDRLHPPPCTPMPTSRRRSALAAPPDLVLTDIMVPILDGFGLLKASREEDRTRTIPVILLSARAGEESRVEGLDAGADDYLTKPFTTRELRARGWKPICR